MVGAAICTDAYDLLIEGVQMQFAIDEFFLSKPTMVNEASITDFFSKIKKWVIDAFDKLVSLLQRIKFLMTKKRKESEEKALKKYVKRWVDIIRKNQSKLGTYIIGYSFSGVHFKVAADSINKYIDTTDTSIDITLKLCKEFEKCIMLPTDRLKRGAEKFEEMFNENIMEQNTQKIFVQYNNAVVKVCRDDTTYEFSAKDALDAYDMHLKSMDISDNIIKKIDEFNKQLNVCKRTIQQSADIKDNGSGMVTQNYQYYRQAATALQKGITNLSKMVQYLNDMNSNFIKTAINAGLNLFLRYTEKLHER